MTFPRYPNPARRAKLLQAHQLRQQGLTLRQIAQEMGCAHSTVAAYLKDFELFRADLIQELAADQLVVHLLQLADLNDEHHDRRRADIRELRLLLTAVPHIRRDESERTQELVQGGVSVDRYGQRYPRPERFFPPTPEEIEQINQPHAEPNADLDPDQALVCTPEPARTAPNSTEQELSASPLPPLQGRCPVEPAPAHAGDRGGAPPAKHAEHTDEPARTKSNKPEQETAQTPAQDGESAETGQISPDPALQQAIDDIDRRLKDILSDRDWLNDYPSRNPRHPERRKALRLVEQKQALLAQLHAEPEAPDAA